MDRHDSKTTLLDVTLDIDYVGPSSSISQTWNNNKSNSGINANSSDIIRDENLALIEVGTLGLIFILIVFGNSCVLLALAIRRLKMTRMYYFLLHLCISDLITGFFTVLPQLAWDITYRFVGGNFLCKSVKCLQILGPYLSSYVLVVTAIDRYQAICFPLSNCGWTPRRSKLMITIAWIISFICSLPQTYLFSYQKIPNTNDVYDCWGTFPQPWGEKIYVTWYAITIFFIPLIILVFTHIYICREIWINLNLKRQVVKREVHTHSANHVSNNPNGDQISDPNSEVNIIPNVVNNTNKYRNYAKPRKCLTVAINKVYRFRRNRQHIEVNMCDDRYDEMKGSTGVNTHQRSNLNANPRVNTVNRLSRAKIKTVKITVVVILCYIICSSPFICVQLWAYWWPNAQASHFWTGSVITILMLLSSLNSCVNPWIYLYFNQNLAAVLLRLCCPCLVTRNAHGDDYRSAASEANTNCNDEAAIRLNVSQDPHDHDHVHNNGHRSDLLQLTHRDASDNHLNTKCRTRKHNERTVTARAFNANKEFDTRGLSFKIKNPSSGLMDNDDSISNNSNAADCTDDSTNIDTL